MFLPKAIVAKSARRMLRQHRHAPQYIVPASYPYFQKPIQIECFKRQS